MEDKMDAETKSKLETAATALEEAIKTNNATEIKSKMEALNAIWNDASTKMYEAAKQQGAAAGAQPEGGPQSTTQLQTMPLLNFANMAGCCAPRRRWRWVFTRVRSMPYTPPDGSNNSVAVSTGWPTCRH